MRGRERGLAALGGALLLLLVALPDLRGQESANEDGFAAESLRLRTSLHYDPLLEEPLETLVKLYVGSERSEELVALYRNHIAQYPDDAGAKTVLIRILRRVDRKGADEVVAAVVPQHPGYAPLQYVLFRFLEERGDARATEALSRAIDLETNPSRRNEWLEELLQLSEGDAARALAQSHLEKLLAVENLTADTLLFLARLMQRHRFWDLSVSALDRANAATPDPESKIEIEVMLAVALGQIGKRDEAGKKLVALLARLAPDHWRRREILVLRLGVLATEGERAGLLKTLDAAYRANPASEGAALDYAEALIASERRTEAVTVLVAASTHLPKSGLIESRTLELLEASPDRDVYARYLTGRLETEPQRIDLRFRLVKAQYALGRDADAGQDFLTVVAGLPPEEASTRILELQRYLRGIDRVDAAATYLEKYVRTHPTRLDVARELAEIRIAAGAGDLIGELVRWLQPEEAETENVLDFSEFLLAEGFAQPARLIVEAKLAVEPRQFDLGLRLVEILGRLGDESAARDRIATFREMTDTAPRYSKWLEAAVSAHRNLETLPGFFDSELNRYNFDDGAWPEEKVEKFLILCETGKRQLLTARIAEGLRKQLAQPSLDANLRLRLRRVLVAVLESDPTAAPEVEEQLKLLATEDPTHRADHDLRRALVYHRSQRSDLARQLFAETNLAEVISVPLLREAADVLVDYGLLREADLALATITRLKPGDLLSWERRLSVLVALGEEPELRSVIRGLLDGEDEVALRELSRRSLGEHLDSSYWRSIAALLESGATDLGATLPLLSSVEQQGRGDRTRLWTEWTRFRVLSRLGRKTEAEESLARLRQRATALSLASLDFPDGLELSMATATQEGAVLDSTGLDDSVPLSAEFLLANPVMRWAFELPETARILRLGLAGNRLLVLDDLDEIHCLDTASGKLLWRGRFGLGDERGTAPRPAAFDAVIQPPRLLQKAAGNVLMAKKARPFAISGDRFFLVKGGDLVAHAIADGAIQWSAPLSSTTLDGVPPGARPEVLLEIAGERLVVFDPLSGALQSFEVATGKLLWQSQLGAASEGELLVSLNTGLRLSGGLGLAYGSEAIVFDTASGATMWRFQGEGSANFPIVLRPPREEGEGEVKARITTDTDETNLFDFRAVTSPRNFLERSSSLVGPAVFWDRNRLIREDPSHATLADGFLWMMQGEKVRRVAVDLPVSSRELPAKGIYIGRAGDHVWFLDGSELLHGDFRLGRTTRLVLGELGSASELRATMAGNQILVRGNASLVLVNALTGNVLGRASLPAPLIDYLATMLPADGETESGEGVWQGRLHRRDAGQPTLCLPVGDILGQNQFFPVFGDRFVASLGVSPSPRTAVPPAPTPQ